MKYSKIAGVDKPVSKIILGTSTPAFMRGENCNALLDCALSLGINAFDTARVYGRAEKALGRWLAAPGVRERTVVISKCCHPDIFGRRRVNARAMRADLKKSLSALGTDYIDIYLLHRDDLSVPAGTVVEELNALHSEGRIGAFGGSNWTHRRIEEANEYAYKRGLIPFAVSSPNYSLARQYGDPWGGGVSICGEEGAAAREWYASCGMPVIAYSSLARGVLSGRIKSSEFERAGKIFDKITLKGYVSEENFLRLRRCEEMAKRPGVSVAQVALAYVLCGKMNAFAVVSCSSPNRLRDNAGAADIGLTAEELEWLNLEKDGTYAANNGV